MRKPSPEILTRLDISYEQAQLALLQLYSDHAGEFPALTHDLTAILASFDRIRDVYGMTLGE